MTTTSGIDMRATLLEELAAAEHVLQAITSRIADQDPTVTPEELEAAERAVRFSRIKLDQLPETERRQELAAAQERADILRADMAKRLNRKDLDTARNALYEAMVAYLVACKDWEGTVNEFYAKIGSFGDLATDVGLKNVEGGLQDLINGVTYPGSANARTAIESIVRATWRQNMHPRSISPFHDSSH